MMIAAGTRLGPYEILAPLGAGGMGEVYRARDSKLKRDVAIKVLTEHLSSSAEVRQRFEREVGRFRGTLISFATLLPHRALPRASGSERTPY
jgi:serine/threonine protein kinase